MGFLLKINGTTRLTYRYTATRWGIILMVYVQELKFRFTSVDHFDMGNRKSV